jgi:hypothetical protein
VEQAAATGSRRARRPSRKSVGALEPVLLYARGPAVIEGMQFISVDLPHVHRLSRIFHHGPSVIDIGTLYLSRGKIPELFLSRAGVPNNLILYARSLTSSAFEFYSCFISYSTKTRTSPNASTPICTRAASAPGSRPATSRAAGRSLNRKTKPSGSQMYQRLDVVGIRQETMVRRQGAIGRATPSCCCGSHSVRP